MTHFCSLMRRTCRGRYWLRKLLHTDGSAYDVTIRSGVRWHYGESLTVTDVKFTYEYFQRNVAGRFTRALRPMSSTTVTGTNTLSIQLSAPTPSFPIRALADVPIMPRHLWESIPGDQTKEYLATIGSGPYRL